MLQVPEIKRGMGLPDTFRLDHGSRRDKIKLLGNGVCAPVMRKVVNTCCAASSTRSRPNNEACQSVRCDLVVDRPDHFPYTIRRCLDTRPGAVENGGAPASQNTAPLDSGAKRNAVKRSGFERPFQARQARLGMAS